jgi:hypothetical protein
MKDCLYMCCVTQKHEELKSARRFLFHNVTAASVVSMNNGRMRIDENSGIAFVPLIATAVKPEVGLV